MRANVIEIDALNIAYGAVKALDGLNLEISEGNIFGLIGPNGAGKTTTINCLSDLLYPDAGSIRIFGNELSENGISIKKRMGILYENTEDLFLYLTGEEFMEFTGEVYNLNKKEISRRMNILFEYLELDPYRFMLIDEYSKGTKKKIALAAILLHNPDLIIMDEPFDGLDTITVVKLKKLLKILKGKNKTVLITSHILSYIEDLTDEVAIINNGKIVFQSKTEDIRSKFKNEVGAEAFNSLEEIFLDVVKSSDDVDKSNMLSWL